MKQINWYNPERNIYPAIAEAQRRGDVVEPYGVPRWLMGVAPGTPAIPPRIPADAGAVRRPTEAQRLWLTYGDAGCACSRVREAGQAAPTYDAHRLAFISIAPEMEWDVREINALDWSDWQTVQFAIGYTTNILKGVCGVNDNQLFRFWYNRNYEHTQKFRNEFLELVSEFCPEYLEPEPMPVFTYDPPPGEPQMVPGTNIVRDAPPVVTVSDDEPEKKDEPPDEKKKEGWPIWGYALAGGATLAAVGGIAYAVTRDRR